VLADQVEKEVERALERVEEHRQGLGRDVEVRRQLRHRLAADLRDRQREVEAGLARLDEADDARIVRGFGGGAHRFP
jgi:hypothetical protein